MGTGSSHCRGWTRPLLKQAPPTSRARSTHYRSCPAHCWDRPLLLPELARPLPALAPPTTGAGPAHHGQAPPTSWELRPSRTPCISRRPGPQPTCACAGRGAVCGNAWGPRCPALPCSVPSAQTSECSISRCLWSLCGPSAFLGGFRRWRCVLETPWGVAPVLGSHPAG